MIISLYPVETHIVAASDLRDRVFLCCSAHPENHPLRTPSGRIELYSDEIARCGYDDCPPHPAWIEPADWLGGERTTAFPLHLVSSQPCYRLHSQMDAGPVSARGKIAGRETLAINPADARSHVIGDGDVVRVFNARDLLRRRIRDRVRAPRRRPEPTAMPMF